MFIFNKYEIGFYFLIYILFLIYGLCNIFLVRNQVLKVATLEFSPGWKIIGRPRDNSNDELENFKNFLFKNYYWYIIHILGSELFRIYLPQHRSKIHGSVCSAFVLSSLHIKSALIIFCLVISYYVFTPYNSKVLVWILSCVWICVINLIKNSRTFYETLGYQEYYELIIALSWSVLKCLSFCLNRTTVFNMSEHKENKYKCSIKHRYSASYYFGYVLYFPTFIFGPFMLFDRYITFLEQKQCHDQSKTINRYRLLLTGVGRAFLWLIVLEILLHFFYVHYMERDIAVVKLLPNVFGLYALGYFMGQYFFLYYVITYGLGITMASFDNLNPPNRPRCIGRIHFYSDMWKYFDQGLYEFLFKHIYAELCSKTSTTALKLMATLATFAFIYIWHGYYMYILVWSALNLSCLVMEKLFKYTLASGWYANRIAKHLSRRNQQRLYALLATQIYIPAAFSNIYFVAGKDFGDYFMTKTYFGGLLPYAALTVCCYCFFQSSEMILWWTLSKENYT